MRSWKRARKVQPFDHEWIKVHKGHQRYKVLWCVALWRMIK